MNAAILRWVSDSLDDNSPLEWKARTFAALAVAIVIGAVANASGVGGGAIYIPLFSTGLGFSLKSSTSLSQACITAGAATGLLANLLRPHPQLGPSMPLVDLGLAAILTPVLLVGVGVGVVLNVAMPSWLLTALLLLLLPLLVAQSTLKGISLWRLETQGRAAGAGKEAAPRPRRRSSRVREGQRQYDGAAAEDGDVRQPLLDAVPEDAAEGPPSDKDLDAAVQANVSVAPEGDQGRDSGLDVVNAAGGENREPESLHVAIPIPATTTITPPPLVCSSRLNSGATTIMSPPSRGPSFASPPFSGPSGSSGSWVNTAASFVSLAAPSFRAFNELGCVDERDGEDASSSDLTAHSSRTIGDIGDTSGTEDSPRDLSSGGGLQEGEGEGEGAASSGIGRAHLRSGWLWMGPEAARSCSGGRRRRRLSYDSGAAAVAMEADGQEADADSWVARRSLWRRRLHSATMPASASAPARGERPFPPLPPHAPRSMLAPGSVTPRSAGTAAPAGPIDGAAAAKDMEAAPGASWDEPACLEAIKDGGIAADLEALATAARGRLDEQLAAPRVGELAAAPAGEQAEGLVQVANSGQQAVSTIGAPPTAAGRVNAERDQTAEEAGTRRMESMSGSRRRDSGRSRRRASARAGRTALADGGGVLAALRRLPPGPAAELLVAWSLYLALQLVRSWSPRCSPVWWAAVGGQLLGMAALSALALAAAAKRRRGLLARQQQLLTHSSPDQPDDGQPHASGKHLDQEEGGCGVGQPCNDSSKECGGTGGQQLSAASGGGVAAARAAAVGKEAGDAGVVPLDSSSSPAVWVLLGRSGGALAATAFAGLVGGLLGLGGGMVMGPMMLQMGVHPQVTAATSSAMVLFSSSCALLQFALLGRLNAHYSLVFGAASAAASLAGVHLVAGLVRRSGRPSVVVLALAGVMAAGCATVAVFGVAAAVEDVRAGRTGFSDVCGGR